MANSVTCGVFSNASSYRSDCPPTIYFVSKLARIDTSERSYSNERVFQQVATNGFGDLKAVILMSKTKNTENHRTSSKMQNYNHYLVENPNETRTCICIECRSTAKRNIHSQQIMLSIWWDSKGVVYYVLLKSNETISTSVKQFGTCMNDAEQSR